MEIRKVPVVIIGSGIAGLLTALKLSKDGINSLVLTKTRLTENSSRLAQGGIAAVLPENKRDSIELHVEDTLNAGAGLADETMTRSILSEGHLAIEDLLLLGVPFDRVDGKLAFTKEAAHTTDRILHAGGDATGRSIQDTLIHEVQQDPNIEIFEECIALDLLVHQNRCYGTYAVRYDNPEQLQPLLILAPHVILATGGIGQLYAQTTNPVIATGDGIALAYQAGAKIQDPEFIQFHPTAFWFDGGVRFLISEALRGEGGVLRDKDGRAFARDYHPMGELAPRDIVTRTIISQIQKDGHPFVHLDITHLPPETIEHRFPNILQSCLKFGIDIRKDFIPVAPATHYGMGGVLVDSDGRTSVNNLYAVGEVVSTGLHGANRLASNSLLECVVLARRVAVLIQAADDIQPSVLPGHVPVFQYADLRYAQPPQIQDKIELLRQAMWHYVGIAREADSLRQALNTIELLKTEAGSEGLFNLVPLGVELRNMLCTSELIAQSALDREESRGAHYRTDYPDLLPAALHSIHQKPVRTDLYAVSNVS